LLVRVVLPLIPGYADVFPDITRFPMDSLAGLPVWLESLFAGLLGGLLGGGSLWLVGEIWKRLRGIDAMGLGDVKMMFGVGALLGWRLTLLTIFLAAFTGAVAGLLVIARSKDKDLQAQIPFGIFLGIGAIAAILFGEGMIAWYVATFIP
ncbi:MAG: A24 family peptidase, partial [Acidobacteriota bacterium]|nr:A24 family peptidase [Acidobacteriota bacterium]